MKNKTKSTISKLILSLLLCAIFTSCGDSNVDLVYDKTMRAYPQGTIGDVFDANFDSTDWDSEEKGGKVYVTFTGKISDNLHEKVAANKRLVDIAYHLNRSKREAVVEKQLTPVFNEIVKPSQNAFQNWSKKNQVQLEQYSGKVGQMFTVPAELQELSFELRSLKSHLEGAKKSVVYMQGKIDQTKSEFHKKEMGQHLAKYVKNQKHYEKLLNECQEKNKQRTPKRNALNLAHEKEQVKISKWLKTYYAKESQLSEKHNKAIAIYQPKLIKAIEKDKENFSELVWPEGSAVKFKWVVNAKTKKSQLASFENASWAKQGFDINSVLHILFKED